MSVCLGKMAMLAAVAAFSMTLPVASAELGPQGKPAAGLTGVRTASASVRRHPIWPRYRVASWYASHLRYHDPVPSAASSVWSAHPILLLVGIGF